MKTVREQIFLSVKFYPPKPPLLIGERELGDHALPLVVVYNGVSGRTTIRCVHMTSDSRGCTCEFTSAETAIDHALDEH